MEKIELALPVELTLLQKLDKDYADLNSKVGEAEQIRSYVYDIMREENHRAQPIRAHDMEL